MRNSHLKTGGRYPVLRAMGILYLFGAIVVVGIGLYWTWWALAVSPASFMERVGFSAVILAATFFAVITVLAIAEFIKLFIDIEHNTRMAAVKPGDPAPDDEESAEAALIRGH